MFSNFYYYSRKTKNGPARGTVLNWCISLLKLDPGACRQLMRHKRSSHFCFSRLYSMISSFCSFVKKFLFFFNKKRTNIRNSAHLLWVKTTATKPRGCKGETGTYVLMSPFSDFFFNNSLRSVVMPPFFNIFLSSDVLARLPSNWSNSKRSSSTSAWKDDWSQYQTMPPAAKMYFLAVEWQVFTDGASAAKPSETLQPPLVTANRVSTSNVSTRQAASLLPNDRN